METVDIQLSEDDSESEGAEKNALKQQHTSLQVLQNTAELYIIELINDRLAKGQIRLKYIFPSSRMRRIT